MEGNAEITPQRSNCANILGRNLQDFIACLQ